MSKHILCLKKAQFEVLCQELPEPESKTGRPSIPNKELLPGVLYVLKTGCSWEYLPASVCSHHYSTCWRRLQFWQHNLKEIWRKFLRILDEQEILS